ncbi:MAG TPA: serine/threonine-protein kinase [Candidatus Tectomicrobia bacterium]
MSLQPEDQIKHYVIKDLIAEGGMGVVWRAWDFTQNAPVAIKAVANDLVADQEFKVRMQDEASRHQRLHHPNIVPVLDVFEADGETCIVMKLIEGMSLDSLLASRVHNHLEPHEAIPIVQDILRALDYAHQHGVVHRDIKPTNVLLNNERQALLIDFGIALAMGEKRRTRTGKTVGTPGYMSPEQITKPRSIDHRSDVYSLGCVFYEMLTGRPPFVKGRDGVADTEFAVLFAHVDKAPTHPKSLVSSIPSYLDELIMTSLEKDPNLRIPGCQEFLRLLERRDEPRRARSLRVKLLLSILLIGGILLMWIATH